MTNSIDANGNNVSAPTQNLTEANELGVSTRNLDAEKGESGRYSKATTHIPDDQLNNNPSIVIRDGSRQHSNGNYQSGDLVVIDGMEISYEDAAAFGLIQGETLSTPSEVFQADSENAQDTQDQTTQDDRPEAAKLLEMQFEVALGDNAGSALETFQNDIVTNGDISEAGIAFAQEKLGMSEQSVQALYGEMQVAGSEVMADYMETGDGLGTERLEFLVDKAHNGTNEEQAIIRNLWFMSATGKLSRSEAADAFDHLYAPYAGA